MTKIFFAVVIFVAVLAGGLVAARPDKAAMAGTAVPTELPRIQSSELRIEFDKNMHSRVVARLKGKEIPLGGFSASETVKGSERSWNDFALASQSREHVSDNYGGGEKLTITGTSGVLRKTVSVTIYDDAPNLAVFDVGYTNTGKSKLEFLEWNNNAYTIYAQSGAGQVPFWSYQSGSYEKRPNWVLPLHAGFSQQNYLGMNDTDYGGGTPIVDVWRADVGLGVGLLETKPRLISLPVSMPNASEARVGVQYRRDLEVLPGEGIHTFRSFVAVHNGDYFKRFSRFAR
jgi:alpha-galactosidase